MFIKSFGLIAMLSLMLNFVLASPAPPPQDGSPAADSSDASKIEVTGEVPAPGSVAGVY